MVEDQPGDGSAWTPAFPGQRPPFKPGNGLAQKHGAYSSSLAVAPRVAELAAEIRAVAPVYTDADEVVVRLLAVTLVRVERALAPIDDADGASSAEVQQRALRDDLRAWIRLSRQLAADLGMTPTSRARLGLDIARAEQAETLVDLAARAVRETVVAGDAEEVAP